MKISVNITDSNKRIMVRNLKEYNLIHRTNMDLNSFAELVFINGLLSVMNGIDVGSKRGTSFNNLRNGEIIEYR